MVNEKDLWQSFGMEVKQPLFFGTSPKSFSFVRQDAIFWKGSKAQLAPSCIFLSSFAHVSFKDTMRLKTRLPSDESFESTQK